MVDYQIVTDATCDIAIEVLNRYHIEVIPMEIVMDDGRKFLHYPDFRNFSAHDFYMELEKGNYSVSSQITPQGFLDFFTPILESSTDILYVCFSSGLSGTYQSALLARRELLDRFPERKIAVIDSLCACTGEGLLAVQGGVNQSELGMSLEENANWLEEHKLRISHFFTVSDLFFLRKGGRVSSAVALAGTALGIKPILIVDENGTIVMSGKVRGRKAAIQRLVEMTLQTIERSQEQILYIGQAYCMEDALYLKELVEEQIPCKEVVISGIGPVIGTHTGPSQLCLVGFGTGRMPKT